MAVPSSTNILTRRYPLPNGILTKGRLPVPKRQLLATSHRGYATLGVDDLDKSKRDRERVVVLGSGWAGYVLAQRLSARFQTVVISPRNYFVFTPLLNSAAVGTLEFRLALEPVRSRRKPNIEFMQGWADGIDLQQKTITIEESVVDHSVGKAQTDPDPYHHRSLTDIQMERFGKRREGKRFDIAYDKLVVAVGCYSQTFGTKGVKEHAYFMKDVGDARRIRKRVLECFEMASLPTTSSRLREQLLRFAIVGGGPTGMEFAAELSDLVHEDLSKIYPHLVQMVRITVHDVAPTVLSMFDDRLSQYAMKTFSRQGITIKTKSHIQELRRGLPHASDDQLNEDIADAQGCYTITTKEEGKIGIGMCIWSTGNMMNPFVKRSLSKTHGLPSSANIVNGGHSSESPVEDWNIEKHPRSGAIVVDDQLRVQLVSQTTSPSSKPDEQEVPTTRARLNDVFALGDNASLMSGPLPATAQTANQQAVWLAKQLNKGSLDKGEIEHQPKFAFHNLGVMAYLGTKRAIVDLPGADISGRMAWLIWRGAYVSKSISWRNRILIPTYWILNWLFGRDITRF